MNISVVVTICHMLSGISAPVCREELAYQADMPMQACMLAQPAIADWKSKSIFAGDQWHIGKIRCIPGNYVPRNQI